MRGKKLGYRLSLLAIAYIGFFPDAFSQTSIADSLVTGIRIQSYFIYQWERSLNEIKYNLRGDHYTSDSLVISRNYYYMTKESQNADRKKNRGTGKFKKIKKLFLYMQNKPFQASEVQEFDDTLTARDVNALLKRFHSLKDVALRDLGITKDEIEAYLQPRIRTRDSVYLSSIRRLFTPDLILQVDRLRSCRLRCEMSSHGHLRHGVVIFLKYKSGREERLSASDWNCSALPFTDFIALLPFLKRLPDQFYHRRTLFNEKMLLDISHDYVHSLITNEKCWVRAR